MFFEVKDFKQHKDVLKPQKLLSPILQKHVLNLQKG